MRDLSQRFGHGATLHACSQADGPAKRTRELSRTSLLCLGASIHIAATCDRLLEVLVGASHEDILNVLEKVHSERRAASLLGIVGTRSK